MLLISIFYYIKIKNYFVALSVLDSSYIGDTYGNSQIFYGVVDKFSFILYLISNTKETGTLLKWRIQDPGGAHRSAQHA